MLAPARLLELNRDLRIIAAAATPPTAGPIKGLSAKNQKFVFMPVISSIRRSAFQKISRFLCLIFSRIADQP
jgi:hypothetical protein